MIAPALHELLIGEAERHATRALALLDPLERTAPGDPLDDELLRELFRALHSAKGMLTTAGLDHLAAAAHAVEDVADGLRRGAVTDGWALREAARAAVARLCEDLGRAAHGGAPAPPAADRGSAVEARLGWLEPALAAAVARWGETAGREVRLAWSDDGLRVPRPMLEALLDALGHLLRNAAVHGIEPPEARRAAGKPAAGTVRVAAWRTPHGLAVEVEDDGCGGAVPAAAGPSPGTELLAGRGVGLEAVRRALEAAGGRVSLDAVPGRSFRVTLWLPRSASDVVPVPARP